MSTVRLEEKDYASLARLVKTRFRVRAAAGDGVELELLEATAPRVSPAGGAPPRVYENFSLIFLGPADRLLPQGMYVLENKPVGTFELFMGPISRDPSGIRYEAVFNRLQAAGP